MTQRTQHTSEDVSVAELELTRQEEALEAEVTRLKVMRKETAEQLSRAKTQAEDPALFAALGRLEVPSVSIKAFTDEAQLARMKALGVRKLSVERSRAALEDHEMELVTLAERMRDEDQGARQRAVQKSAELEALAAAKKKAQAEAAAAEEDSLAATMLRAIAQPDPRPSAPVELPLAPQTPTPTVQAAPKGAAQRRVNPRASLCAEITLGSDSNFFTGFTNDVSEGGLFVATVNLLPLGTQIDLSFSLPNGPKVEGKGEVRWVREFDEKYPDTFPGMGIKFLDIPLPSVAAIHAFTVQREPMFFPEN